MDTIIFAQDWISYASHKLLACDEKPFHSSSSHDSFISNILDEKSLDENLFFTDAIMTREEARREASIIFCHCLGMDKIQLRLKNDFLITEEQRLQLEDSLERRAQKEPLAYIFGYKEFFGIDFMVNKHTLIPRPETEFLVDETLSFKANDFCFLLDLGCGSGCIALSVLKNRPHSQAVLVDISPKALAVAHENAVRLGIESRAHFILADFTCANFKDKLIHACKEISCLNSNKRENSSHKSSIVQDSPLSSTPFDIIISNPPYIPLEEYQKLHTSVKDYEPQLALVSPDLATKNKEKGLFHAYAVILLAEKMLKASGMLLIEHGYNQAQDCRDLCDKQKWKIESSGKDYAHVERYLKVLRSDSV